jgi:hypothetical protein
MSRTQFGLELRHITCTALAKPAAAPLLVLQRGNQNDGLYVCPLCGHTIGVYKRRIEVKEQQ